MQNDTMRVNYYSKWILYGLALFFILPLLSSCSSSRTIVNGLDEKQANEIIVYLSTKGVSATKVKADTGGGGGSKIVTYDIQVPEDRAIEAMSLLNQAGLPRRPSQNLLGIFSNVGLVPSEMEQKVRYQAGLAEQIASVIRKIDGVLDAEVQISFPEEDTLNPGATKGKITASVYVKHNGVLDDPNSHLITKIKRLVSSSVTGLDYDNVTVIPDLARNSDYTVGGAGSVEGQDEKQYVNVWSIILAKESATKFQIVFFSFFLIILLLILTTVWLGWKIYPVLKEHGGFKELLHLKPLGVEKKAEETAVAAAPEAEKEKTKKPEEKGTVDKDVDET